MCLDLQIWQNVSIYLLLHSVLRIFLYNSHSQASIFLSTFLERSVTHRRRYVCTEKIYVTTEKMHVSQNWYFLLLANVIGSSCCWTSVCPWSVFFYFSTVPIAANYRTMVLFLLSLDMIKGVMHYVVLNICHGSV